MTHFSVAARVARSICVRLVFLAGVLSGLTTCASAAPQAPGALAAPNESVVTARVTDAAVVDSATVGVDPAQPLCVLTLSVLSARTSGDLLPAIRATDKVVRVYTKDVGLTRLKETTITATLTFRGDERNGLLWLVRLDDSRSRDDVSIHRLRAECARITASDAVSGVHLRFCGVGGAGQSDSPSVANRMARASRRAPRRRRVGERSRNRSTDTPSSGPERRYWKYADQGPGGTLVLTPSRRGARSPVGLRPGLRESARSTFGEPQPTRSRPACSAVGTRPTLVILAQFGNKAGITTAAEWQARFFGATGSVKHHYAVSSYNQMTIAPRPKPRGPPTTAWSAG